MGISYKFFDKAEAENEEIAKAVEAERAAMTDEEREKEKQKALSDVEMLMEMAERNISEKQKHISEEKVTAFRELSKVAVKLAEVLELNVDIEDSDNGLYGIIKFSAESIIIVEFTPEYAKKALSNMIATASETLISYIEDKVELLLTYNFY